MISNIQPRLIWAGNDATSSISLSVDGQAITFSNSSEIAVRQRITASGETTTLALGVDYTVTGWPVTSSSGTPATLTRIAGALPSGYSWSVLRVTPASQPLDILSGGDFSSGDIEGALDRATAIMQELRENTSRAFKASEFDGSISVQLPAPQALNYLRWNADETALEGAAQVDLTGTTVSSFIETLLDDADGVEARTTLGLGPLATIGSVGTGLISDDAVTYAKIQNITASARFLGRKSSGAGNTEEMTFTEALDLVGSAAQGDILYRGASAWTRLGAGTSGQFLKTLGTGADPAWAAIPATITSGTSQATTSGTSFEFASIPSGVKRITISFDQVSLSGSDNLLIQLGDSGGVETTIYTSASAANDGSGVSLVNSTAGFIILVANATRAMTGHMVITRLTGNVWVSSHCATHTALTSNGAGRKELSAELDRVRITVTGANTFDAGQCNIHYET